jgi:hypothetical protein
MPGRSGNGGMSTLDADNANWISRAADTLIAAKTSGS